MNDDVMTLLIHYPNKQNAIKQFTVEEARNKINVTEDEFYHAVDELIEKKFLVPLGGGLYNFYVNPYKD